MKRLPVDVGIDAKRGRLADARHLESIFARLAQRGEIGDVELLVGVVVARGAGERACETTSVPSPTRTTANFSPGAAIVACLVAAGQVADRIEADRRGLSSVRTGGA